MCLNINEGKCLKVDDQKGNDTTVKVSEIRDGNEGKRLLYFTGKLLVGNNHSYFIDQRKQLENLSFLFSYLVSLK